MSVYLSIKHRFGARLSEWFVAVVMALWGAVQLLPGDAMAGPTWVIFRSIMPEQDWGGTMLFLGCLRLAGLIINGAMKKVTPWIRSISALIGLLVFVGLSVVFALSGSVSTWLALYPAIAVLEVFNVYRAGHDVGEANARISSRSV